MTEHRTAQVTGPQLEVIALLAEGLAIPDIAAKTGTDNAGVNRHILAACIALGASDRVHLIALAYRHGLLRIHTTPAPAPTVADEDAAALHGEIASLRERLADTTAERDELRENYAVVQQQRAQANRAVAQLRSQLEQVAVKPAETNGRIGNLTKQLDRATTDRATAQAEAVELRQRATELQRRVDRYEAAGAPRPHITADTAGGAIVQLVLDLLAGRAAQAREAAARSGLVADLSSARLARDLDDVAKALIGQWQHARIKAAAGG